MKKLAKSKKGLEIGELYNFILLLVLTGMILGVGILVLDKFRNVTSITAQANATILDMINAITPIGSTWLPLVVTVVVLAIILTLVIRSFSRAR